MDKAEYRIATDHIKKLIAQGEYAEASYIADTIDWSRVKSVMMLCTVSDLYKVNRRYEDAKEILYMAYERNPGSRTILYSLCDLSIKLEEFVAAIEYYKSFVEVAPRDTGRYVLQYRLYQAQDVSLEERIEVLEQLKSEEYIEKWAYELAYLYHRIGFATKCVEECDELILWFGKGRYVYKAMELKMLHEPLTPSQQRIYDNRFEHMEQAKDMTRVLPRIDSGDSEMTNESMVDVTDAPTVEIPQEYVEKELHSDVEDIQVKTLDVANAYNTMNLQKELADSLREILEESRGEATAEAESPAAVTQIVAEHVPMEEAAQAGDTVVLNDIQEVPENEPEETCEEATYEEPVFQEPTVEEEPVENIVVEEVVFTSAAVREAMVDEQITGQLTIDDILAEWDKQEEAALEAHQEEISARIKSQTQDIFAAIEAEMKKDVFETFDLREDLPEVAEPVEEEALAAEEFEDTYGEVEELEEVCEETYEEPADLEEPVDEQEKVDAEAEDSDDFDWDFEDEIVASIEEEIEEAEEVTEDSEPQEEILEEAVGALPETVSGDMDLNRYSNFVRAEHTAAQISRALEGVSMEAPTGNARVTGQDMSICFDFIKTMMSDLKGRGFDLSGKTAKISAVNLNKKEPSEIISKVREGILIIERAGRLRKETVAKLKDCMNSDDSMKLLVFLTDTQQAMERFVDKYPELVEIFPLQVDIKDYSSEELVAFGERYALEHEHSIDMMGVMALRGRIEEMIANDEAPTMADTIRIVDRAIENADRKSFRHFMHVLLHKRYDSEDMIILHEEDFE